MRNLRVFRGSRLGVDAGWSCFMSKLSYRVDCQSVHSAWTVTLPPRGKETGRPPEDEETRKRENLGENWTLEVVGHEASGSKRLAKRDGDGEAHATFISKPHVQGQRRLRRWGWIEVSNRFEPGRAMQGLLQSSASPGTSGRTRIWTRHRRVVNQGWLQHALMRPIAWESPPQWSLQMRLQPRTDKRHLRFLGYPVMYVLLYVLFMYSSSTPV